MGCGNSSATSTTGGPPETAKDEAEEPPPEDEKRKNYGGVYVGLPADLSIVATTQTASTRKGPSRRTPNYIQMDYNMESIGLFSSSQGTDEG